MADAIAAKNPGLFVRTDVCFERHKGIDDRLRLLSQLSMGILIGVALLVIGTALKVMGIGTP